MELKRINNAILTWQAMTNIVLDLRKISSPDMHNLLRETYFILNFYRSSALIPKEVSKLLLEMDDFLYFASLMENKEVGIDFYNYKYIYLIITALKKGFYESEYGCDFPKLKIIDVHKNEIIIDFGSIRGRFSD